MRQTNLGTVDAVTANRATGSTNGAAAGTYWVEARITDRQGHTRYAYSKSFRLTGSSTTQAIGDSSRIEMNSTSAMQKDATPISGTIDLLE